MKILMHICCGPCSVMCIKTLREQGHDLTGYWYNPNIHPYMEYKSRKKALIEYAEKVDLPLIINNHYGLRDFVKMVVDDLDNRCVKCYYDRIFETARKAKELGFDAFTTTLLISPYQQHENIKKIAESIAKKLDIPFHYVDFRPYFREGQEKAREAGLYMQKYCGCVFSEEERYKRKKKHKSPDYVEGIMEGK